MLFEQFVDDDLGCASYLVGDEDAGVAVVVDPAFAIEQYVEAAERHEVRITHAVETHTHADHVSGHGRLALEQGVPAAIHPAAGAEFPHRPLEDGAVLEVGAVALTVLHTPGHRPEHCSFAVADRTRGDEPWLVLTGDSLFVADVARPDLAVAARAGAEALFASLRRLTSLGDGVELYPGHVAGSMCGSGMSSKASSTIGFERRFNAMLQLEAVDEFVRAATAIAAPRPPNIERIVALNRGPFVAAPPDLEELERCDGCTVVDVRAADEFARGHVRGALSIPVAAGEFGTKAGFVLSPDERVVLHAASRDEALAAARGLRAVGLFELAGYAVAPPATERLEPVDLDELERLVRDDTVEVLDVREADERDRGYIPGSRHIPYRLLRALGDGVGRDRPVVTICETGARAGIAASILAARGVDARPVLAGGVPKWRERGNPMIDFRRCGS